MRFIIILFFILIVVNLEAEHIVGGDATYVCLGVDDNARTITIQGKFTIYRDAFGEKPYFDFSVSFGVYIRKEDEWDFYRSINNVDPINIEDVTNSGDNPCLVIPSSIKVDKADYIFEVTLPWIDEDYMIVYQRCCRNTTVNNINIPDETGAAFSFLIHPESQRTCNNSPVFKAFPPIIVCLGEEVDFDHSAVDSEGDELVYSFCAPLTAGGPDGLEGYPNMPEGCNGITPDVSNCLPPFEEVSFTTPTYDALNPLGGDPQVNIDPATGMITGAPNVEGQFVVGVCVEEIRNGEVLNTIRRDFQFNVVRCDRTVVAEIVSDEIKDGQFYFSRCGESEITFENQSYLEENISEYSWLFVNDPFTISSSEVNPTISFSESGIYEGIMVANPGSNCGDTAHITVEIFDEIEADFSYLYDTCLAGPILLEDQSAADIVAWKWLIAESDTIDGVSRLYFSLDKPGKFPFHLNVTDINGCQDSITRIINWNPAPNLILAEPSIYKGCLPAIVQFDNYSTPIDTNYQIVWNFGDGFMSTAIEPMHTFTTPGIFDIEVEVTSPSGCKVKRMFPDWIEVLESPIAGFSFTPENPTINNNIVQFFNESQGEIDVQWNFDTVGFSLEQNPEFEFRDTGRHIIQLVVANEVSCTDTAIVVIDIAPITTLFLPNAFTPNNDARNDAFLGVGQTDGLSDYNMSVYNRYGEMIFSSDNPNIGWHGRKHNTGQDAPAGVYLYTIDYLDSRGKPVIMKGYVTLIR